MRIWLLAGLCVAMGIVWAARAHGDVPAEEQLPHEAVESGLEPAPPSAAIPSHVGAAHEPNTPYDPGPESALWRYADLNDDEKALVDRNKNTDGWQGVHDSYGAAVREQAQRAAALAAEHQLGLEDSGTVGVVP
ncbi:MAG: hypothetical protein NT062_04510 [Proteobacteria bacterium]|nr:hypothetical protein [Pseudomonadota bacterium]